MAFDLVHQPATPFHQPFSHIPQQEKTYNRLRPASAPRASLDLDPEQPH